MSSGEAGRYRLTPAALDDLDETWRFSAERWSIEQADQQLDRLVAVFETIAAMPLLARERPEFTPPVRIHTHHSHIIVYTITENDVVVLRVLGAWQDWMTILNAADRSG